MAQVSSPRPWRDCAAGRRILQWVAMTLVTRFAPSPTGRLHVGNLRTGLLNWLLARKAGGRFLLRMDDTDRARSTEEFARLIRDDLDLFGLAADEEFRQSDREALYQGAFDRLRAAGRIYPAYETPEELELARKVALSRRRPPIYDRAALQAERRRAGGYRGGRAASRTGASASTTPRRSNGTIWCAGRSASTRR